nr:ABC transporter ATP-binding protein [uncultured Acetatifactor sp.]
MAKEKEKLAVETLSLTKSYNGKAAVNHLSMQVRQGAIYGFIGRNGAGKSTTLKMLCGLAKPTEGEIRLFGKPAEDSYMARRLGCLIESTGLYPNMTARQNMMMKAKCMGLTDEKSVDRALASTGLADTGSKKARYFSMGMKQRLGIGLALLGNPDLLILDEPINGLDPEGTREVRELLLALSQEGKTLIISSHILGELSKIATHYGIIKEGNLVEQIDRETLEGNCRDYFQIEVDDSKRALPLILEHAPQMQAEVMDDRIIRLYDLKDGAWLNHLLIENRVQVYSSGFHHMDLEEYFLKRMDNLAEGRKGGEEHV